MISGFLTSVIGSLRPRQHIEERLTLIIDFYIFYSGFFSSEAFDKRTNRVSTDVADKHARYTARLLLSPAKSRRSRMNWAIMAHIVASDYCFCKRTAIISAAKVRHCKRKDCPDALFLCRENGGQQGHVFLASSCLTPIRGLLYLIRNKVDY